MNAEQREDSREKGGPEGERPVERPVDLGGFFDAPLDLLCIAATDGRFLRVNAGWSTLLGFSREELEGRSPLEFIHPDDIPATQEAIARLNRGESLAEFVNRYLCHDGTYHWLEWRARLVGDLIYASALDVTTRRAAEEALRESEERFRLIAENVADVIWVFDLETFRYTYVSPSVKRLRGYTPEEAMQQSLEESLTPESFEYVMAGLQAGLQKLAERGLPSLEGITLDQPCKDGSIVKTELSLRFLPGPDGRPAQVFGISRDITKRRLAEEALLASQERLKDLVFVVGDWIWETDADHRYVFCSEGVRSVLGYSPEEVVGKQPWDFMPPDEAARIRAFAEERVRCKDGCSGLVNRNLHRDGHEVVLSTSVVPILDASGALTGFRGVDKDITEAVRNEQSLRRSVTELNTLWRISETVAGPDDLFAAVNSVMQQISDVFRAKFSVAVIFGEGVEGRHVITADHARDGRYDALFTQESGAHVALFSEIARGGLPLVINDLQSTPGPIPSTMVFHAKHLGFSRVLLVPLMVHAEIIGALVIIRGPEEPPFESRDTEFAQAAAGSIAASIVHARLRQEEKLRAAAHIREHLARELHDAVTQSVYSASLIAQALPHIWRRSKEEGLASLEQLQKLVRSALAELRILLYELRPATLEGVDLSQLLERLADSLGGQSGVEVRLEVEPTVDRLLPTDAKVAMYRIAQEAFNNIAKHAKADNVRAVVQCDDGAVVLTVEDDGVGFVPPAERKRSGKMGIDIMRERANEVGAELKIENVIPTGTRVAVRWRPTGTDQGGEC